MASTTTDTSGDVVKSKMASQPSPGEITIATQCYLLPCHTSIILVAMVKAEVHSLRGRFNSMKMSTIQCLERCCIAVATVVYILTEIRALDQHRVFLEKKHNVLFRSKSHLQLFSVLNFYWNYISGI